MKAWVSKLADPTSLLAQTHAHLRGEKSLADAMAEYDAEMIARGGDEVSVSLQSMHLLMTWELVQEFPLFKRSGDLSEAALKIYW